MRNSQVADMFDELADLLDIEGENHFKVRAYRNAARAIRALPTSLEKMTKENVDLSKISGIGVKIAKKIKEIIKTGKLQKLENVRRDIPPTLRDLLSIEGLGPKRIRQLYDKLGVTDLDSLHAAAASHRISALDGFGGKTEQKILKGVHMLKQEGRRHLFADAESIAEDMRLYLLNAPSIGKVQIAGSFRRREDTVGDLDILCSAVDPNKVVQHFIAYEKIKNIVVAGSSRSTIVLNGGMQIDLRVIDEDSYGSALHYFTGSKAHVLALRRMALKNGMKISEYGVYKGAQRLASKSEKEVYAAMGLSYIEPELRENRGEIEAARENALPCLITRSDIKGDLHMHTNYSDGVDSVEVMRSFAKKLGYEYIAITDHDSALSITKGMDRSKVIKQIEKIDTLNAKGDNPYIFKGVEVDILEDGSLAMDDDLLERFDFAIAAVHSKFNLSKKEQTKRVIKAIQNPYVKAIAHPTGRLIAKREAMVMDFEQICKVAVSEGKFLEINSQPERMDLSDILIKAAKELGVQFIISTDAHSANQLEYMRYGINQARRGWLEAKDVINTLSLKEIMKLFGR